MQKYIVLDMKKLLFTLMMILSFSYASADNITAEEEMIWGKGHITRDGMIRMYINVNSIKKNGSMRTGWVKFKSLTNARGKKKGDYTLDLFQIDCQNHTFGIISSHTYNARGTVLDMWTIPAYKNIEMKPIAPGTTVEFLSMSCLF